LIAQTAHFSSAVATHDDGFLMGRRDDEAVIDRDRNHESETTNDKPHENLFSSNSLISRKFQVCFIFLVTISIILLSRSNSLIYGCDDPEKESEVMGDPK
jgi:hypothetical protein